MDDQEFFFFERMCCRFEVRLDGEFFLFQCCNYFEE